jgi:hypothetical protein
MSRSVASLDFAGNVTHASHRSKSLTSESKYEWKKDAAGRVILARAWSKNIYHDPTETVERELVVTSLHVSPAIAPNQFDVAALQIRKGSLVEDRVRNRRYTFEGRKVSQDALDALSKEIGKHMADPEKK